MKNLTKLLAFSLMLAMTLLSCKKKAEETKPETTHSIRIVFVGTANPNVKSIIYKFYETADQRDKSGSPSFTGNSNASWDPIAIDNVKPGKWHYATIVSYKTTGPGEFHDSLVVEAGKTTEKTWQW
jgi:hypothetical protein